MCVHRIHHRVHRVRFAHVVYSVRCSKTGRVPRIAVSNGRDERRSITLVGTTSSKRSGIVRRSESCAFAQYRLQEEIPRSYAPREQSSPWWGVLDGVRTSNVYACLQTNEEFKFACLILKNSLSGTPPRRSRLSTDTESYLRGTLYSCMLIRTRLLTHCRNRKGGNGRVARFRLVPREQHGRKIGSGRFYPLRRKQCGDYAIRRHRGPF